MSPITEVLRQVVDMSPAVEAVRQATLVWLIEWASSIKGEWGVGTERARGLDAN